MKKDVIVVHSGGMDSSISLNYAVKKWGKENVLSLSFSYGQRHSIELEIARKISDFFEVDHAEIDLNCLNQITSNALMNKNTKISYDESGVPNTLVVGRNGLMARLASIHAESLGAKTVILGVIEIEESNSGYRDCSRTYMDLIEKAMRLDLADDDFKIETPLVKMNKVETYQFAKNLGNLEYLLETTVSCYEGIRNEGCMSCPACTLRNKAIFDYQKIDPAFKLSYLEKINHFYQSKEK